MVGFKPRQLVRLHGLQSLVYNGTLAVVKSSLDDDGRHLVELQAESNRVFPSVPKRAIRIKPENLAHACNYCHSADEANMKYCSKCKMALYCNRECQQKDWRKGHNHNCQVLGIQRDLGRSPLIVAALRGDLAGVQSQVQEGADVNKKCTKTGRMTPLFVAASGGHLEVVQDLLENGANVNKAVNDGATPLLVAAGDGRLKVVQCLVGHGADINMAGNDGSTPLREAAAYGMLEVVQYLAVQGADINMADNDGATPLMAAVSHSKHQVAEYLRQHGAV